MIKLLKALKEIAYVQKPLPRKHTGPDGYNITGTETDPVSGKSTTYLESEPKLAGYAKDIGRMIKQLKFYEALPSSETNNLLKSEARSIIASLRNAEGKMRDFLEKQRAFKNL